MSKWTIRTTISFLLNNVVCSYSRCAKAISAINIIINTAIWPDPFTSTIDIGTMVISNRTMAIGCCTMSKWTIRTTISFLLNNVVCSYSRCAKAISAINIIINTAIWPDPFTSTIDIGTMVISNRTMAIRCCTMSKWTIRTTKIFFTCNVVYSYSRCTKAISTINIIINTTIWPNPFTSTIDIGTMVISNRTITCFFKIVGKWTRISTKLFVISYCVHSSCRFASTTTTINQVI